MTDGPLESGVLSHERPLPHCCRPLGKPYYRLPAALRPRPLLGRQLAGDETGCHGDADLGFPRSLPHLWRSRHPRARPRPWLLPAGTATGTAAAFHLRLLQHHRLAAAYRSCPYADGCRPRLDPRLHHAALGIDPVGLPPERAPRQLSSPAPLPRPVRPCGTRRPRFARDRRCPLGTACHPGRFRFLGSRHRPDEALHLVDLHHGAGRLAAPDRRRLRVQWRTPGESASGLGRKLEPAGASRHPLCHHLCDGFRPLGVVSHRAHLPGPRRRHRHHARTGGRRPFQRPPARRSDRVRRTPGDAPRDRGTLLRSCPAGPAHPTALKGLSRSRPDAGPQHSPPWTNLLYCPGFKPLHPPGAETSCFGSSAVRLTSKGLWRGKRAARPQAAGRGRKTMATSNGKTLGKDALEFHAQGRPGKLEIVATKSLTTQRDLSLAYSPGVAEPCLRIQEDPSKAYDYTAKGHLVAVISNDTAVLE